MSGIIGEIVEEAEEVAGAFVGEAEAFLRPRPGGKIEAARRQREAESLADEPVAQQDYLVEGRPVAVDTIRPDTGIAKTVTLTANNPVLPVLPRDSTRRTAFLMAVDNAVYLSSDPGAVANAVGDPANANGVFYLPPGPGFPWLNTDQLWAGATSTASPSRVSVISDIAGTR
jgi:hypothetical protein